LKAFCSLGFKPKELLGWVFEVVFEVMSTPGNPVDNCAKVLLFLRK
jgi:hypothetical protein